MDQYTCPGCKVVFSDLAAHRAQRLTATAECKATPNLDSWIRKDGVRHDASHSLRSDTSLTPGEAVRRNWRCTCGHSFGLVYDNAAVTAYRLHRKEATK